MRRAPVPFALASALLILAASCGGQTVSPPRGDAGPATSSGGSGGGGTSSSGGSTGSGGGFLWLFEMPTNGSWSTAYSASSNPRVLDVQSTGYNSGTILVGIP